MKLHKITIITLFMIVTMGLFAASGDKKKNGWYENNFQFGFGFNASTGNLLGIIETGKMIEAESKKNNKYTYPGMTEEESKAYNDLPKNMKTAIWVSNIFASLDYGLHARILWRFIMVQGNLNFVPMESSYNGRFDFVMSLHGGVRLPFFIMPYFTMGPNFTFSFYPDNVAKISTEDWKLKSGYGVVDNFVFRPGLNFNAGLEIKFKKFSLGGFYTYIIKDFDEFNYMYKSFKQDKDRTEVAAGLVFSAQSKFGIAVTMYF